MAVCSIVQVGIVEQPNAVVTYEKLTNLWQQTDYAKERIIGKMFAAAAATKVRADADVGKVIMRQE